MGISDYVIRLNWANNRMPSLEIVIVVILGITQGYCAIPFYIYLVRPIVEQGPFPNKKFKVLSIALVFIALISTYFAFAGLLIGAIPESEHYFHRDYYRAWFLSQFFGMLVWALFLSSDRKRH